MHKNRNHNNHEIHWTCHNSTFHFIFNCFFLLYFQEETIKITQNKSNCFNNFSHRCHDAYGSFVRIHKGHLCAGKLNGRGGTCVVMCWLPSSIFLFNIVLFSGWLRRTITVSFNKRWTLDSGWDYIVWIRLCDGGFSRCLHQDLVLHEMDYRHH